MSINGSLRAFEVGSLLPSADVHFRFDREKVLYLATMAPPFFFALYIYVLMRRNPRTLIKSLTTIVPGLQHEKGHSEQMVKFRLRAEADLHSLLLFFQANKDEVDKLRREVRRLGGLQLQGSSSGVGLSQESQQAQLLTPDDSALVQGEILVNQRHFAMLSFVPAFFLGIYFWDAAVLSREVSKDFPLMTCLSGDECFYIERPYNFWSYPHYKALNCEDMRRQTVSRTGWFAFRQPEQAHFYKCYTWVFGDGLQNLIQGLADSIALTAVSVIVILYFCVEFTNTQGEDVNELHCQRKKCTTKQVALVVVGVGYVMWVAHVYGSVNNEFVGYLSTPGLCAFFFTLLCCRKELLQERIMNLEQQEASDSREYDDSSSGSGME